MIVRQIVPGVPVRAVILAHGAPGPFRQVRSPEIPRLDAPCVFGYATLLGIHRRRRLATKTKKSAIRNRNQRYGSRNLTSCKRFLGPSRTGGSLEMTEKAIANRKSQITLTPTQSYSAVCSRCRRRR